MALIDEIEARYTGRRTEIEVPEWGQPGAPLVLYAKPFTIADDRHLARWAKDDDSEGYAEIVVRKAETADGEPYFRPTDRVKLARVADAHVVKRIAMQIATSSPTVEDAEGN